MKLFDLNDEYELLSNELLDGEATPSDGTNEGQGDPNDNSGTNPSTTNNNGNNTWITFVIAGVIIVALIAFFFFSSRKNKQRQQEIVDTIDAIRPGHKVKTNGGICGLVVEVCDDNTFIIETGSEATGKSYVKMDKECIYQTDAKSPAQLAREEQERAKEAAKAAKENPAPETSDAPETPAEAEAPEAPEAPENAEEPETPEDPQA